MGWRLCATEPAQIRKIAWHRPLASPGGSWPCQIVNKIADSWSLGSGEGDTCYLSQKVGNGFLDLGRVREDGRRQRPYRCKE